MKNVNKEIVQEAEQWDMQNPPMPPVGIPKGYKAKYRYKQPVICQKVDDIPIGLSYETKGGWGIVSMDSGHKMDDKELGEHQEMLKAKGLLCIGTMRLVKQYITLDQQQNRIKKGKVHNNGNLI